MFKVSRYTLTCRLEEPGIKPLTVWLWEDDRVALYVNTVLSSVLLLSDTVHLQGVNFMMVILIPLLNLIFKGNELLEQ